MAITLEKYGRVSVAAISLTEAGISTTPWWVLNQNWQTDTKSDYNYSNGEIPIDQEIAPPSAQYPGGIYQSAIIGGHEADGSNCTSVQDGPQTYPIGLKPQFTPQASSAKLSGPVQLL